MAVGRDEEASFALFYLIPQPRPDVVDAPVKPARLGRLVALAPQVQAHGATARALQALRDGGPDRLRRLQEPPLERRLGFDVVLWEQA